MSNNKELISIITPVFNGEKYIRECIESVLMQEYPCVEHIIVDDGSNDNTLSIVEEYPHVQLIRQAHCGATVARNAGLLEAKGRYVKFLDADDVLAGDALANQWQASANLMPDEIGYGFSEEVYSSGKQPVILRRSENGYLHPLVDIIFRNVLISLPLYPREALISVGGFDERLRSGQEWNLHIKLARHGYQFIFQDIFIFHYRIHDSEHRISNRKIDWAKELQNFEYSFEALAGASEKVVIDAWAAYLWSFGRRALREGQDEGAELFFCQARKISGSGFKYFLPWKYRLALTLLGVRNAEVLIAKINEWRLRKDAIYASSDNFEG